MVVVPFRHVKVNWASMYALVLKVVGPQWWHGTRQAPLKLDSAADIVGVTPLPGSLTRELPQVRYLLVCTGEITLTLVSKTHDVLLLRFCMLPAVLSMCVTGFVGQLNP
jgi:hypothetical protein